MRRNPSEEHLQPDDELVGRHKTPFVEKNALAGSLRCGQEERNEDGCLAVPVVGDKSDVFCDRVEALQVEQKGFLLLASVVARVFGEGLREGYRKHAFFLALAVAAFLTGNRLRRLDADRPQDAFGTFFRKGCSPYAFQINAAGELVGDVAEKTLLLPSHPCGEAHSLFHHAGATVDLVDPLENWVVGRKAFIIKKVYQNFVGFFRRRVGRADAVACGEF